MGSFAAGASLTQRVPASTAASAEIPPSKTYRTGTLAVKVGMTQGACPQGFTRHSSFVTRPPWRCPRSLRPEARRLTPDLVHRQSLTTTDSAFR